jgi:hypothetical protein
MFFKRTGIVFAVAISFLSLTNLTQAQSWTQLISSGNTTGTPLTRRGHTAVYDEANNQMTIFGGLYIVYRNDVWVLSNANGLDSTTSAWIQLAPTGSTPTTRYALTAVYDTTNNRMIIFGGISGGTNLNDVWILSHANGLGGTPAWTQLSPTGSAPTTRYAYTAVYDAVNNRMTIFGGISGGTNLNDVWVLSNANGLGGTPAWTQLTPTGSAPTTRWAPTAVYGNTNNRMIIFGGISGGSYLNDVWVLSTANGLGGTPAWIQLAPTGSTPTTRYLHTAVYDNTNNRMTLFGGYNPNMDYLNDVWVLNMANWVPINDWMLYPSDLKQSSFYKQK